MKGSLSFALVTAGPSKRSLLARLPALAERLGLVKAPSLRLASRVVNSLRSGKPARQWEELAGCEIVLVDGPPARIPGMVLEMSSWQDGWHGKAVVLCNGVQDSGELARLAPHGASLASVTLAEPLESGLLLLEGEPRAVRLARRLFQQTGARVCLLRQSAQPLYLASLTLAGTMLPAVAEAAMCCLRHAGLATPQARRILQASFEQSLRAYRKGGRKSWREPSGCHERKSFQQQWESLRAVDPPLADFFLRTVKAALASFGKDTAWMETGQFGGPRKKLSSPATTASA